MWRWGEYVRKALTLVVIVWVALFWRSTGYLFWAAIIMGVCGVYMQRARTWVVMVPCVTMIVAIVLYCIGTESALYYMWPALSATVVTGLCSALLLVGVYGEADIA